MNFYWPWVVYPMGKYILILKGSASGYAILVAAVKAFIMLCGYHEGVSLFIPFTVLCSVLLQ